MVALAEGWGGGTVPSIQHGGLQTSVSRRSDPTLQTSTSTGMRVAHRHTRRQNIHKINLKSYSLIIFLIKMEGTKDHFKQNQPNAG